jgi:hypothetical protein
VKSSCIDLYPSFILGSVLGILIDIALVIIVLSCILSLKIRRAQKIGLLIIANLGWLTIFSAILRTVKVDEVVRSSTDVTWTVKDIVGWTSAELCTMMICATAPVLKPLIKKFEHLIPEGWVTVVETGEEENFSAGQTVPLASSEMSEAASETSGLEDISKSSFTEGKGASEEFTDTDLSGGGNRVVRE